MDEVDSYSNWVSEHLCSLHSAVLMRSYQTLFAIFFSICVLIGGVVLLTHKKPEPSIPTQSGNPPVIGPVPRNARRSARRGLAANGESVSSASPMMGGEDDGDYGDEEDDALRPKDDKDGAEQHQMWQIGDDDDEEDGIDMLKKDPSADDTKGTKGTQLASSASGSHPEQHPLVPREGVDERDDEFGEWEDGSRSPVGR